MDEMDEFQKKQERINDIITGISIILFFLGFIGVIYLAWAIRKNTIERDYYFKYYNFDGTTGYSRYCGCGYRSARVSCELEDGSYKMVLGYDMIRKDD